MIFFVHLRGGGEKEEGEGGEKMSEKKFTPRPWKKTKGLVYASMHHKWRNGVELFRNRFMAQIHVDNEISEEELEANINLIHAAPDLYEALTAMLEEFQPGQLPDSEDAYTPEGLRAIELARAAIEKAEGEGR